MSIYNSYKTNILKPASVLILHMKNETISGNYHKIHSLGHRFHFCLHLLYILGKIWQLQSFIKYILSTLKTRDPLQGNPTGRVRVISNVVRSIGQLQPRLIGENYG